jgi:hypothetical protein
LLTESPHFLPYRTAFSPHGPVVSLTRNCVPFHAKYSVCHDTCIYFQLDRIHSLRSQGSRISYTTLFCTLLPPKLWTQHLASSFISSYTYLSHLPSNSNSCQTRSSYFSLNHLPLQFYPSLILLAYYLALSSLQHISNAHFSYPSRPRISPTYSTFYRDFRTLKFQPQFSK